MGLWFRNQVMNAMAIPGIARLAVGREIIDTLRLPEYHLPRVVEPASKAAMPMSERADTR